MNLEFVCLFLVSIPKTVDGMILDWMAAENNPVPV